MTENNNILIENIQNQLYELYIDLKTFLVSTEKEKQNNENQKEISSNTEPYTIIEYLKNCINILIKEKQFNTLINSENDKNNFNNNIIGQLESYIKKLENDLKFSIKKQFMFKIQKDALENKIRGYMEIEEEYEELKEKVRYEGGKFLNNDRKDNEIIILRRENSNLKKEINKIEEKNKNLEKKNKDDQEIISGLKFKVAQLNKKVEEFKEELNDIKNKKNNSLIKENNDILNINKNISAHYNKTSEKDSLDKINIQNINNLSGIGNNKNNIHLKRDLTNYHLPFNNFNFESTKNNPVKALNTIDNNNKLIISSLNKMYNNNKNFIAPIRRNNKFKNAKKTKCNSVAKRSEENEKKSELMIKYLSNNTNHIYDASRSKIRSLNKINKNIQGIGNKLSINKSNINIRNIQREDKNLYEHSAWNIFGINQKI